MKSLSLVILVVSRLTASEVTFEFSDEVKMRSSHEEQMQVLLETYDAVASVIRAGVYRWQSSEGPREVNFDSARVVCYVTEKSLKVIVPDEVDSGRLDAISN